MKFFIKYGKKIGRFVLPASVLGAAGYGTAKAGDGLQKLFLYGGALAVVFLIWKLTK